MFICTFDLEMKKELDKKFNFLNSVKLNGKTFYIYEFNKQYYSLFDKNEKVFITNKLFF